MRASVKMRNILQIDSILYRLRLMKEINDYLKVEGGRWWDGVVWSGSKRSFCSQLLMT